MSASRSRSCSRRTPYLAEDAADLVDVEIEELPVVLDAAAEPGEFERGRSTEPAVVRKGYGDVDAAFRAAHAVVELDARGRPPHRRADGDARRHRALRRRPRRARDARRRQGAALEPRPARAHARPRRRPRCTSTKAMSAAASASAASSIPRTCWSALAALRLGRPVKWIEDRREHLIAANHSRQQRHRIRAAIDAAGPHPRDRRRVLPRPGRLCAHARGDRAGPRRGDAARAVRRAGLSRAGHIRLTNKTPCGTYRAPGRYESTFVRERLMDAIAAKVGIDPVEVRRRNLIRNGRDALSRARSTTLGTEVVSIPATTPACSTRRSRASDWDALQARPARAPRRRRGGRRRLRAVRREERARPVRRRAHRRSTSTGDVEVVTGAASVGQGIETVIAQICADALGVDYERVRVVHGQTDRIDYGMGAFASRVTVMTGAATHIAAAEGAREGARGRGRAAADAGRRARHRRRRRSCARTAAGPSMTLAEVARALRPAETRVPDAPGLSADGWFHTAHMTYPYGVHVAVVRVDRETGGVADRALSRRLRRRARRQPDADRRPDRRRRGAGHRRRAARGVRLRRARPAARGRPSPTT